MNAAEKFWNSSAKNYDRTEERFEYIHRRSRENAKRLLEAADVVLDYGCGTGTTACELADQVKEIQAIDISSSMIEIANDKAIASDIKNVSFKQGDIFDDGYSEASFDAILAFNILHTVPNPQDVMRRIHDLLKPDGLIISVTPCLRDKMSFLVGVQIKLVRLLCRVGVIPIPIRRVKSTEVVSLVENGGFKITETDKIYQGASSCFLAARKLPIA